MKNHSFAVTAVGIAHGTGCSPAAARGPERPVHHQGHQHAEDHLDHHVITVNSTVTDTESRNWLPGVPGGQLALPHCWNSSACSW